MQQQAKHRRGDGVEVAEGRSWHLIAIITAKHFTSINESGRLHGGVARLTTEVIKWLSISRKYRLASCAITFIQYNIVVVEISKAIIFAALMHMSDIACACHSSIWYLLPSRIFGRAYDGMRWAWDEEYIALGEQSSSARPLSPACKMPLVMKWYYLTDRRRASFLYSR